MYNVCIFNLKIYEIKMVPSSDGISAKHTEVDFKKKNQKLWMCMGDKNADSKLSLVFQYHFQNL